MEKPTWQLTLLEKHYHCQPQENNNVICLWITTSVCYYLHRYLSNCYDLLIRIWGIVFYLYSLYCHMSPDSCIYYGVLMKTLSSDTETMTLTIRKRHRLEMCYQHLLTGVYQMLTIISNSACERMQMIPRSELILHEMGILDKKICHDTVHTHQE